VNETTNKVLAGCGIGCLLVLVALAGLGWMGYRWGKTAVESAEGTVRSQVELEERLGSIRDYTPPLDGAISTEHLETFLFVRESMAPEREALAAAVADFAPAVGEGGAIGSVHAAKATMRMAPRVLEFVRARNQALLDADMGLGEYTWIYWLTCHGWLGHSPGESLLHDILAEHSDAGGSVQIDIHGWDAEEMTLQLRRNVTAMVRNLHQALEVEPEPGALSEIVAAELAKIDNDPYRVPWQDGLPEALAVGLEPYRGELLLPNL
jgi:hypothetical protein